MFVLFAFTLALPMSSILTVLLTSLRLPLLFLSCLCLTHPRLIGPLEGAVALGPGAIENPGALGARPAVADGPGLLWGNVVAHRPRPEGGPLVDDRARANWVVKELTGQKSEPAQLSFACSRICIVSTRCMQGPIYSGECSCRANCATLPHSVGRHHLGWHRFSHSNASGFP